ncbi:2-dehydropantoate 2-reductase [Saccharata proteae CBS 121410]|uniref:2-dehydropantoate 2-reductase n=1 Tax=Saccharata proteae CBS 121410 TaxID=1314787 RepID=A0A9P4LYJ3_9PEZI|nr:2-dehydropantoate 2-reductase [Saccharata proteae CBS 121410]
MDDLAPQDSGHSKGSIGKLVAHSLRNIPNAPPVTLVFHKASYMQQWLDSSQELTIVTDGFAEARGGYDAELAVPMRREHQRSIEPDQDEVRPYHQPQAAPGQAPSNPYEASDAPITNLIVTTKAPSTVSAVSAVAHRLTRDSTILFLQNGMGTMEEVTAAIFPQESTRPNYMQGIITHGVNSTSLFSASHAGSGTIQLGIFPRKAVSVEMANETIAGPDVQHVMWPKSSRYLLRTLTRAPALCAVGLAPVDLLIAQLEKLAVNCVVNPLTALLDVRNGGLLYNFNVTRVQRLLLSEISLVIRSLPEFRGLPNLAERFSPERLETLAVSVAATTGANVSSMLADVRRGRQTEVEYTNGYIVKRGEEMGIRCALNYLVMCLVRSKQNLVDREMDEEMPVLRETAHEDL